MSQTFGYAFSLFILFVANSPPAAASNTKLDILGVSIGMTIKQATQIAERQGMKCTNREFLNQGVSCSVGIGEHGSLWFGSDKAVPDEEVFMVDSGRKYPANADKDVVTSIARRYTYDEDMHVVAKDIMRDYDLQVNADDGKFIKSMLAPNIKLVFDEFEKHLTITQMDVCVRGNPLCPKEVSDLLCLRGGTSIVDYAKNHPGWMSFLIKHPRACR